MESLDRKCTFTVYEPVRKNIEDITEDHLKRLDRMGAIVLSRQFRQDNIILGEENKMLREEVEMLRKKVDAIEVDAIDVAMDVDIDEDMKHELSIRFLGTEEDGTPKKHTKRFKTQNRWTDEQSVALKGSALKGLSLTEMHLHSTKKGLPYTKSALEAQLRLMGFSIIKGIPILKDVQEAI
jgi:hypothetical protein